MDKVKEHKNYRKWLLAVVAVFFITVLLVTGSAFGYAKYHQEKIYPGVLAGEVDLGNKTPEEAEKTLYKKVNKIDQEGVDFYFEDASTNITPIISSFSGDAAYSIIEFRVRETVEDAFDIGRNKGTPGNAYTQARLLFDPVRLNMRASFKEDDIKEELEKEFSQEQSPAEDASLKFSRNGGDIDFYIEKEKFGETVDYEQGLESLKKNLKKLDTSSIYLQTRKESPQILKEETEGMEEKAEKITTRAPIVLLAPIKGNNNASQEWDISRSQLASWLQLKKEEGEVTVGLDREKIEEFLDEAIAPQVEKEPEEAQFDVKDGRVTKFSSSKDGIKLDLDTSLKRIKESVIDPDSSTSSTSTLINLATEKVESKTKSENANDLGIKEIIGTGESDFSGSPDNRVHNINVGAETLGGQLIEPEEEFSLVEALGEIDKESGYKPELVIKNNKTVPEYGGGLCQIATTMFRAALESGLEITERRNHSYRVSYYEPAGTDATIYPPHPDLRFVNDTEDHILIQYRIEESKLYFDFWGTDDGREVKVSEPEIYNLVKPGPTKTTETTELEPGERKCTESAHTGADAHFDYKVIYSDSDKETKERRFRSHYVPWREVCLVGVEGSDNKDNKKEGATSTPSSATSTPE